MEKHFINRIKKFDQEALVYGKRYRFFSIIRILVFFTFLVLWIFLINESHIAWFLMALLLFPFIFGFIVNKHRKLKYKQQFLEHLSIINQEEVNRLNHKPQHFYDGSKYQNEEHPYSGDLDIFGSRNIYHFINRSATPAGEDTLANWLSAPASKLEVEKRQEAVHELTNEIDWRQEIQASELEIQKEHDLAPLLNWTKRTEKRPGVIYLIILPILIVAAIALWIMDFVPFYVPLVIAIINEVIIYRNRKETEELADITSKGLSVLKKYRHIIYLIENKPFNAPYLQKLQLSFKHKNFYASVSVKRLERILEFLDARGNLFYHILNAIFLLDLQINYQALKWKSANEKYISQWFQGIGEMEAVCSIAGYAYSNPAFIYPVIVEENFILEAQELGHPLIPEKERINNDFQMKGKGAVSIITGSNMSGKSTFLRTVGINAVLAYAGSPVCAKNFRVSEFDIFTSMRTKDDLEAHVSSFYAELKRIRQLLNSLKENKKPMLFALDEILKGTNSHDRHAGAKALVRQLNEENCMGMVSTHDIELGVLADDSKNIKNMSFNSDIIDDKILFDYKINEGTCRSFNASKLMEQMGIEMNKS